MVGLSAICRASTIQIGQIISIFLNHQHVPILFSGVANYSRRKLNKGASQ